MTTLMPIAKLNSRLGIALTLSLCAVLFSACTKGGGVTGSEASSVTGSLTLQKTYPTPDGETWTPITAANRFYLHDLSVTVTGTCTRGIDKIRVHEGSLAEYSQVAICQDDGSWTWNRTFLTAEEGDKTLTFTAYDIAGAVVLGSAVTEDVRVDATAPDVSTLVVTDPGGTPFHNSGVVNTYTIQGTCSADTVRIRDPDGNYIVPVANSWSYVAHLVEGATLSFTFYAYDLAGNQSAGRLQVIEWAPVAGLLAGGAIPGGTAVDASGMKLEGSVNVTSGKIQDSGFIFNLFAGFNFIVNKARGL